MRYRCPVQCKPHDICLMRAEHIRVAASRRLVIIRVHRVLRCQKNQNQSFNPIKIQSILIAILPGTLTRLPPFVKPDKYHLRMVS
jgi:hypothetical protein